MKKILKSSIQYIGLISSKPIPENQIFEIPPGPSLNWLTPMLLLVLCPLESFVNFESCQRCRNKSLCRKKLCSKLWTMYKAFSICLVALYLLDLGQNVRSIPQSRIWKDPFNSNNIGRLAVIFVRHDYIVVTYVEPFF